MHERTDNVYIPALADAREGINYATRAARSGDPEEVLYNLGNAIGSYNTVLGGNNAIADDLRRDLVERRDAAMLLRDDIETGRAFIEGTPASWVPPRAPARPGPDDPEVNAVVRLRRIEEMHAAGARAGNPLLPDIGRARDNINRAIQAAEEGDEAEYEARRALFEAINDYNAGLANNPGMPDQLRRDVEARRDAANTLLNAMYDGQITFGPAPGSTPISPEQTNPEPVDRFGPESWIEGGLPNLGARAVPEHQLGVDIPNFIETHPNAADPNAGSGQFAAWGERAGQIAHAARNRPGVEEIVNTQDNMLRRQLVSEAFGAGENKVRFGNSGYTLEVTSAYADPQGYIGFEATIVDEDGYEVGRTERSISRNYSGGWKTYNAFMKVEDTGNRKSGFASAFNQYMENWYIANGFDAVTVSAAGGGGYTGAFVWAMNGFDFNYEDDESISNVDARINAMGRQATQDFERAQLRELTAKVQRARDKYSSGSALVPGDMPTPREFALIGWTPGARDWLGKQYMSNNGWSGIKRLAPTDVAYQQRQAFHVNQRSQSRVDQGMNRPNLDESFLTALEGRGFSGNNADQLTREQPAIMGVLRENQSLAALPVQTKARLFAWANAQLANIGNTGGDETIAANLTRLRDALDSERRHDFPDNIAMPDVGRYLAALTPAQLYAGRIPGFNIQPLLAQDDDDFDPDNATGDQRTFKITHQDTGQVFYVKFDQAGMVGEATRDSSRNAEHDVNLLLRNVGWAGIPEYVPMSDRLGIVMQRVGDGVDLLSRPQDSYRIDDLDDAFRNLANPEQLLSMFVLDVVHGNGDRNPGNFKLAQDRTGHWWIFPIDHGLAGSGANWSTTDDGIEDLVDQAYTLDAYRTLGELIEGMGPAQAQTAIRGMIAQYRNALGGGGFIDPRYVDVISANLDKIEQDIAGFIDATIERNNRPRRASL